MVKINEMPVPVEEDPDRIDPDFEVIEYQPIRHGRINIRRAQPIQNLVQPNNDRPWIATNIRLIDNIRDASRACNHVQLTEVEIRDIHEKLREVTRFINDIRRNALNRSRWMQRHDR